MQSAFVEDLSDWWCIFTAGAWSIIPVVHANGAVSGAAIEADEAVRQLACCRVDDLTVLLVFAHFPALAREAAHSLARAAQSEFSADAVLIVTEASEGFLRVDTSCCGSDEARRAAYLAAAVVQASWAWDESPRIRIASDVESVAVEPRHDGAHWRATLVEPRTNA